MDINFKGGYFNFNFLTKSDWTLSSQSMDNVQSVHGLSGHCPVHLDSLDFVQGVHGQCPDCPLSPLTMSTESMDNVHWIHGHCPVWLVSLDFIHGLLRLGPEYPWTLSRLSTESMVNVHWVHGQCPGSPLSPWTFYRQVSVDIKSLTHGVCLLLAGAIYMWKNMKKTCRDCFNPHPAGPGCIRFHRSRPNGLSRSIPDS